MYLFRFFFLSLILSLGVAIHPLYAQVNSLESSNFELFGEAPPLKLELSFDYKHFIKKKYKDEYQNADLKIFLSDSVTISDTIRIRARGEFRRKFCQFPPIRLNFKKADFIIPELKQLEKVKLVTTCRYQTVFQQYLFQEYLIYKAYNLLTNKSFRVRLVDITYIDTGGKKDPFQQYGFIIEEVDKMAARNDCIEIEPQNLSAASCEPEETTLMTVFQYMIGNTDFLVNNLHNIKTIRPTNMFDQTAYAVPYDFDYSGMVNTTYAIPQTELGIESVRERLYRGYCFTPAVYTKVINRFKENKKAIYSLYEDYPYFDKRTRRESISYLDDFYKIIENPALLKQKILSECK